MHENGNTNNTQTRAGDTSTESNYPKRFRSECEKLTRTSNQNADNGFAVIPYVQGVTRPIKGS